MPRKLPRLLWLILPMAYVLYLYGLDGAGLLGPDEPRYSFIAREMARTGDWITPRLWGEPWFEKPVLLYWMGGAAYRLGLGPELAPRLPVALLSLAFLVFYWWALRREFGERAAWFSALILGTSSAWIGFSHVGVTDLPLAATFSAAMLLAIPWAARGESRLLPATSALLGLAVLAKGLVPLVLCLPLLLGLRNFRDLLRPRVVLPFLAVALPWYLLCYIRNGSAFVDEFFFRHHFGRFATDALKHVQPAWFYLPVLPAFLLPWTPLLPLVARVRTWSDPRRRFLLAWVLFGLLFFSLSANKLPGYVLPLLPALAALAGISLDEVRRAHVWLAACALLLTALLLAGPMLAPAVANGLSRTSFPAFHWTWLLPAAVAVAAAVFELRGNRLAAVLAVAAATVCAVAWLKTATLPKLDHLASARTLARQIAQRASQVCIEDVERDWRYGLAYYLAAPLPDCTAAALPLRLTQQPGEPPQVTTARP